MVIENEYLGVSSIVTHVKLGKHAVAKIKTRYGGTWIFDYQIEKDGALLTFEPSYDEQKDTDDVNDIIENGRVFDDKRQLSIADALNSECTTYAETKNGQWVTVNKIADGLELAYNSHFCSCYSGE